MTDRTEEILDLAALHADSYSTFQRTNKERREAVIARLEEVGPLEGEVWDVIPFHFDRAPLVVTATKLMVGWEINPVYLDPGDGEDNIIGHWWVYPVERIAEAPAIDQRED